MPDIRLVVLDVDGVLRDSSRVFYDCHKKGLECVGLGVEFEKYFTVKDIWHFKGLGRFNNKRDSFYAIYALIKTGKIGHIHEIIYEPDAEQIISRMVNSSNVHLDEEMLDRMVEEYRRVAMSQEAYRFVKIYPGIGGIIKMLKAQKKIAIFTNSDIAIVRRDLKELLHEFDYVITPKDVRSSKPSGEGLTLIARESGIGMKNIVYVGDTVVDVRTARDAGCISAVVTSGMGLRQHLEKENPDFIFEDLKDAAEWIIEH